jgi:excisionase family DNA binding protein
MLRAEMVSRKVRERFYYSVEEAGKLVGLSRTQAYQAVELGTIPAERYGKLLLVPRAARTSSPAKWSMLRFSF